MIVKKLARLLVLTISVLPISNLYAAAPNLAQSAEIERQHDYAAFFEDVGISGTIAQQLETAAQNGFSKVMGQSGASIAIVIKGLYLNYAASLKGLGANATSAAILTAMVAGATLMGAMLYEKVGTVAYISGQLGSLVDPITQDRFIPEAVAANESVPSYMVDLFYDIFTTLYNQYNQAVAAAQKVNNGGGTTGTKTTPTQTVTLTEQQQTALGQVSSLTGAINQALLKFKADFITNNGGFVVKTFNGVNNTNATVALQTCLTQLMSDYNAVQTAVANAKAAYTVLAGAPTGTGKGVAAAMQSLKSAYSAQNSGADYYLPNQGTNFNLTLTNYASYTGLQNYLGTAVTNIQNAYNAAMQIAPMQKQQPSQTTTTTPTALKAAQQSALNNYTADITALNNAVTAAQAQMAKDQSTYVTQLQQATTTSAVTTAYNNGISALANDFIAAMANCCVNNNLTQGPISTAAGVTTGTVAAPLLNLQNDLANLSSIPSTATQYQTAQNAIPTVQAAIAAAMDTANAFPIDAYILTPGVLNSSTISTYADVSATGNGALGASLIALQNAYNAANTRVSQQNSGSSLSIWDVGGIILGGAGLVALAVLAYMIKRNIDEDRIADVIDAANKDIADQYADVPVKEFTPADVATILRSAGDAVSAPTSDSDGSLATSTVNAASAAQKAATESLGSSATPEEVDAAAQAGFAEAFDFTPSDIEMMSKAIVAAEPDLSAADQSALGALPDNVTLDPAAPVETRTAIFETAMATTDATAPATLQEAAEFAADNYSSSAEFKAAAVEGNFFAGQTITSDQVVQYINEPSNGLTWKATPEAPALPAAPDAADMPGITSDDAAAVATSEETLANDVSANAPTETLASDFQGVNEALAVAGADGADISGSQTYVEGAATFLEVKGVDTTTISTAYDPVAPTQTPPPVLTSEEQSPAAIQQMIADKGLTQSEFADGFYQTARYANANKATMSSEELQSYRDSIKALRRVRDLGDQVTFSQDGQPFTVTATQKFNVEIATKTNPIPRDYAEAAIDSGMTKLEFVTAIANRTIVLPEGITVANIAAAVNAPGSGLEWPTATGTGTGTNNQPGTGGNGDQPSGPTQEDLQAIAAAKQDYLNAIANESIDQSGLAKEIATLRANAAQLRQAAEEVDDAEQKQQDLDSADNADNQAEGAQEAYDQTYGE